MSGRSLLGHKAESIVAQKLKAYGYFVVARNVRFRIGEIDIVAQKGDILYYIEVRSRRGTVSFGEVTTMLGPSKIRRMKRCAQLYSMTHGDSNEFYIVIAVVLWKIGQNPCIQWFPLSD